MTNGPRDAEIAEPAQYLKNAVYALHDASRRGNVELIERMLDEGVNVNAPESSGETALLYAAFHGNRDAVTLLLARGANVHHKNEFGRNALERAAQFGNHPEIEKLLIGAMERLHVAAERGDVETMGKLLDNGTDPNGEAQNGTTALHWASRAGKALAATMLLDRGADPRITDHNGRTPLHNAENAEVARVLLAADADVHARAKDGETPLDLAYWRGKPEVTRLLKDEVDSLYKAANTGDLETLRRWRSTGADVNAADERGRTALHWAVDGNQLETVKTLLAWGANPFAHEGDAQYPIWSMRTPNPDLKKLLQTQMETYGDESFRQRVTAPRYSNPRSR